MDTLERFALRWLQQQLREILSTENSPEQSFPAELPLSKLPGKPNMRWLYAALRRRGVLLPPLFLSTQQHLAILAIAFHVFATVQTLGFSVSIWQRDFLGFALFAAWVAWCVLAVVTKLFFSYISSADTIGELATQIFAEQPMFFSRLSGIPLSRALVQEIVTRVLIEACGVDRSEVTLGCRLVDLTD